MGASSGTPVAARTDSRTAIPFSAQVAGVWAHPHPGNRSLARPRPTTAGSADVRAPSTTRGLPGLRRGGVLRGRPAASRRGATGEHRDHGAQPLRGAARARIRASRASRLRGIRHRRARDADRAGLAAAQRAMGLRGGACERPTGGSVSVAAAILAADRDTHRIAAADTGCRPARGGPRPTGRSDRREQPAAR